MGRRQRKREKEPREPVAATDYTDGEGNVLTLRDSLSSATVARIRNQDARSAANVDDVWQRREEMLFERLVVSWTIAGLPLEKQDELLGRYRLASTEERRWVRATISSHLELHLPELLP